MQELTVFEQEGKLLTDSREVSSMVDKDHSKLLRDIRGYCKYLNESNFGLVDFFVESTYTDSKGEERPCYLCTKKGCDMIANKMTGRKGVIFTAKYTTAFEKMRDFIEKGSAYSGITLKEQVESLEAVSSMLHMNDASKLLMLEKFYKEYNIPTGFLPKYEHNGNRQLKSLSALLEENHCGISAVKFNKLLLETGYLEERFNDFEQSLPLLPEDADDVSKEVKKRVVEVLGGKESNAYHDKSLSQKVFMDAYRNLKSNFDVSSYKAIKRNRKGAAVQIAREYRPPLYLAEQIQAENVQMRFA